ncbi:LysR family transporter transcriptional regulator [Legionella geestiana]|uniref:LysR family transporter transcriptional regulator n=2 Tax=Legionella geestiana TaxID=45065 RepID=A0A0W0TTU2_9GAMM|nr:LysR family transcriptional regulator [Legionella geestiana]KTC99039.1 LysR family transporter transcriptional regulator [Legionella geestiana]QBS13437.1 LysR family transcriptional regulator [Legionella geestiana]QDQ41079.1 LysR family transcriptional regulator [Legionella geestiana]STX54912.1 transcriptional regulator [Legionella geestiana]
MSKVTIEQWRVLQTVVDEGSFAKASIKLHKSQSSISYTVAKLQDTLGLKILQMEGRRARLTEQGTRILNLSRQITRAADYVETSAHLFNSNCEKTLRIAVDEIFPMSVLMSILHQFGLENQQTRIKVTQGVLSGPAELLVNGEAELAVISKIPEGYLGKKIMDIDFIPYAHEDSPLHAKPLTNEDLLNERYIITQDSGVKTKRNEGWLGSEFNWSVSSIEMKIQCVAHAIGFAWLPKHIMNARNLPVKPLILQQDDTRTYPLYLVHQNPEEVGPAARRLIHLFTHGVTNA